MFALPVSTHPSISRLTQRLTGFVRGRLWLQVLVAMFAGIATGMAIGPTGGWLPPAMAQLVSNWLAIPGYLFLAMVQMIVIPLVAASVIDQHTASLEPQPEPEPETAANRAAES